MHIVISTKLFYPVIGGSIVYARILAREFVQMGHQVSVLTRTSGGDLSNEPYKLFRNLSFLEKLRLAESADALLQVDSSWQDAFPFVLRGVPWFPTVHRGNPPLADQTFVAQIRLMAERMAYRFGKTIAVSDSTAKSWRLPGQSIPNPYDDTHFHPPLPGENRDVDILFVGSIVRHKGIFVLAEALRNLPDSRTDKPLKVVFVGEGSGMPALRESIQNFPASVEFLIAGPASPPQVAAWMRRSHILAFPTTPEWTEASPLTPLEAAACGCLVVATDSGGTRENVSTTHWLVKPGDADELSRAISEAISRPYEAVDQPTRILLEQRKARQIARKYIDRFESVIRKNSLRNTSSDEKTL